MQIEPMLVNSETAKASLTQFFNAENLKSISEKSSGSCFSAYAAYEDSLYINDFIPDEKFVLNEREWYTGAKRKMGKVNVSDPYIDANTGEMCYSISKLLSDEKTVVGLDFSMNELQTYIEEMNKSGNGSSLIVNEQGMILGHSNPEYVGKNYIELPFYNELVNKVYMLYGDFFEYKADGVWYNIFSDKTNYDWYLVVCVQRDSLQVGIGVGAISIIGIMVVLMLIVMALAFYLCNKREHAQSEAKRYKEQLEAMQSQAHQTIIQFKDQLDFLENEDCSDTKLKTNITEAMAKLGLSMEQPTSTTDSMVTEPGQKVKREHRIKSSGDVNYRKINLLITCILVATSIFAIIFNTRTQVEWGRTKMQKESDQYLYQVQKWITSNSATLDVIANSITAQPGFEEDYDDAIQYLDDIVSHYEDISVAYLSNPQWEHTVLMNNGWEPDADWHVEERQWYIDTMQTSEAINIASPYLDEQTGLYCITLSKIVYDENGNFIGVLGIDYYLDKLIDILGKSYTDTGYAFLTDMDGNILNHPYEQYQMKPNESKNAANLCYRTALAADGAYVIQDYEARFKASTNTSTEEMIQTAPEAHVLIVDDNETNLLVAKSLLKRTKVQADTASSGKECIERLKTQFYHIVFLDHMMPEMDGIETLAVINEQNIAKDTIFVALTANAIRGAKESYLENGFHDYLSKPISGKNLEKCLFHYLPKELIEESHLDKDNEVQTPKKMIPDNQGNSEDINLNTGLMYVGGKLTGLSGNSSCICDKR